MTFSKKYIHSKFLQKLNNNCYSLDLFYEQVVVYNKNMSFNQNLKTFRKKNEISFLLQIF